MQAAIPNVSKSFAEFGVRMFALGLDLMLVSYLVGAIANFGFGMPQIEGPLFRVTLVTIVPLYFTLFWMSPVRATPAQFLFGMCVVDESGNRLDLARAVLRAIIVMGIVAVIMAAFWAPKNRLLVAGQLAGFAMVFLSAVTPNRQAFHDFIAKSIVVNRKVLSSEDRREQLLAHVADKDPTSRWRRLPSIFRMLVDGVVLAMPAMFILTATSAAIDKNMRSRVAYAVSATKSLQFALEEHYVTQQEWPAVDAEFYAETTYRYPEGGYYQLEDNGLIRIRFEVKPELTGGSVVLYPEIGDDEIRWKCRTENLDKRYMPSMCRYD